ncbi:MAG TPA: hypothetical protein VME46_22505 [Acidimicrobiales bacterium]|nr:hypothetical protein [Acidimicrobiales bacterium]
MVLGLGAKPERRPGLGALGTASTARAGAGRGTITVTKASGAP